MASKSIRSGIDLRRAGLCLVLWLGAIQVACGSGEDSGQVVSGSAAIATAPSAAADAGNAGTTSTGTSSSASPPASSTPVAVGQPVVTATPLVYAAVAERPSRVEAARFLIQSTYGPTMAEIDALSAQSYDAWLTAQFAAPSLDKHLDYVLRKGPIGCSPCNSEYVNATMESFWLQAVRGRDQLRQRTVFALSEIFVVSTVNSAVDQQPDAHASYLDMLARNAFGNFRTLLEDVARHPTMGKYLSHLGNEKEDPATGRTPDENFAREVMQLFTIGLWELNEDGTRRKDSAGRDIPSYSQADVNGMARVFTGLGWAGADKSEGRWRGWSGLNWTQPMQTYPVYASTSEKRIVRGVVIPAGTGPDASLSIALDTLFNHPNTGPFIGHQLIKRFVTSNPTAGYVQRVARAFANNGSGVRGDMRAVVRAVLMDPEARDVARLADPNWGKLREPMVRYGNFMRAFDVKASSGIYMIWNLEDPVSSLGQNPLRAPSVFNYFRPDYAPPGDVLASGLVAPEFQITHETTVTGYTNFILQQAERQTESYRTIMAQYGSTNTYLAANVSAELALADRPELLLDRLNLLLMAGQMTPATRATILEAVNDVPMSASRARDTRVALATALTMASPEYTVQK